MKLFLPEGCWGDESVPFDQPSGVVGLAEGEQRLPKILDRIEGLHPQEVLLQRSDEALGTTVSLGRAHEGGRAFDAEEFQLFLKSVGHVLRSVIMPDGETSRGGFSEAPEIPAHTLADRFERLEAGGSLRGMDADAFGGAMIDRDEYRRLALAGDRRR